MLRDKSFAADGEYLCRGAYYLFQVSVVVAAAIAYAVPKGIAGEAGELI
jgi:hypothetical protein